MGAAHQSERERSKSFASSDMQDILFLQGSLKIKMEKCCIHF